MMRLQFSDPATAITDYVLAVESFVFAFLLYRSAGQQASVIVWATAFVAVGVSALSGGYFHHRRLELEEPARRLLWKFTAAGLCGAVLLFVAGGIFASVSGSPRKAGLIALAVLFAGGLFRKSRSGGIVPGKSVGILALILTTLVLTLVFQWLRHGSPAGIHILVGSVLCITGVIIQQAAPKLHRYFNHNDVCHVFFIIGLFFLYFGGLLLKDKT